MTAPTSPSRTTLVAAYVACTDDEGRILLCRVGPGEADAGHWMLPGGGLDFGEDPAASALRELREESGLTGELLGLATVDARVHPARAGRPSDLHKVRIVYRGRATGGTLRDETDGSTDTCAWFTLYEARRLPLIDVAEAAIRLLDDERDPA